MSNMIIGAFNLDQLGYNKELYTKTLYKLAKNHYLEKQVRVMPNAEVATALFNKMKDQINSNGFDVEIHVGDQCLYRVIRFNKEAFFTQDVEGNVHFAFTTHDVIDCCQEETFIGVGKTDLHSKIPAYTFVKNKPTVVNDPNNYLIGFDNRNVNLDEIDRGLLETTDEWLERVSSNENFLKTLTEKVVQKVISEFKCKPNPHATLDTFVLSDFTKEVYIKQTSAPANTIVKYLSTAVPEFEKLCLNFVKSQISIELNIKSLRSLLDTHHGKFFETLFKEDPKPKIVEIANYPRFKAIDPKTNLWDYCKFVGNIGVLDKGELMQCDCGLWVAEDGSRVSATFVTGDDHTSYHTLPIAKNGKVLDSFTENQKVNEGTVLTAINNWIYEKALELNYII